MKPKNLNLIYKDYRNERIFEIRDSIYFEDAFIRPYFKNRESHVGTFYKNKIMPNYDQPHRFFHTRSHISEILLLIESLSGQFEEEFLDDLRTVAYFHDIIYDPTTFDNELNSGQFFIKYILNHTDFNKIDDHPLYDRIMSIYYAILATKNHESVNDLSYVFNQLDMYAISHYPFERLLEYEHQIFKEYQFVNYTVYKESRTKILLEFNKTYQRPEIDFLVEYVNFRKPNIGIYPGSFKPFHLGHMDIKIKAERIFDKVIIARGINKEKESNKKYETDLEKLFPYNQVDYFEGYLYDYINGMNDHANISLIKGLRNEKDFAYEHAQEQYNQHLHELRNSKKNMPVNILSIFGDPKLSHISSSGIRYMEEFEKGSAKGLSF